MHTRLTEAAHRPENPQPEANVTTTRQRHCHFDWPLPETHIYT